MTWRAFLLLARNESLMHALLWWFSGRLRVRVIHIDGQPYLERYALFRCRWFTAYLHRFVTQDEERWLHNHPWRWSCGIPLCGGYLEERLRWLDPVEGLVIDVRNVKRFRINHISARTFHRIVWIEANTWTLFLHTPKCKGWGFLRHVEQEGQVNALIYEQPFTGEQEADFPINAPTGREIRA